MSKASTVEQKSVAPDTLNGNSASFQSLSSSTAAARFRSSAARMRFTNGIWSLAE